MLFKKKDHPPLEWLGLAQATGLAVYCSLVAFLFWRGNEIFGSVPNYLGPLLFLILFVTSALVSALATLGYPFILFYKENKPTEALKLVGFTAGWLVLFALFILIILVIS